MSADIESKSLTRWLRKERTIEAPPPPTAAGRGNIRQPSTPLAKPLEHIRQLNLKINDSTYRRIKELAYRDRVSLVTMLEEMVDLYEKAHGKIDMK